MRQWLTKNNWVPPLTDASRIEAKIRVQLAYRNERKENIAGLIGCSYPSVENWASSKSGGCPSMFYAQKLLSLISEDGELLPS